MNCKDIDVNAQNGEGKTALMVAAGSNREKIVKVLLMHSEQAIQLLLQLHGMIYGITSIMFIPLILLKGANKEIRNNQGKTAYDTSFRKKIDRIQKINSIV